eukprot:4299006-Pyramimonas_sp.AAC.1
MSRPVRTLLLAVRLPVLPANATGAEQILLNHPPPPGHPAERGTPGLSHRRPDQDQSDAGCSSIFSQRNNHMQDARIYSHDGPIRRRMRARHGHALSPYPYIRKGGNLSPLIPEPCQRLSIEYSTIRCRTY